MRRTETKREATSPRKRARLVLAVTMIAALAALAFSAAGGARPTAADAGTPSWTLKLKDGSTFVLAKRIQDKIKKHEKINYVFSYGSSGIQGFSQQYLAGYKTTLPEANKIYPMTGKAIAPSQPQGDA